MKFFDKILLSIIVGFSLFTLLNLFFGKSGYIQSKMLEQNIEEMSKNIEVLKDINKKYDFELRSRLDNSSRILVRARDLGYYEENDYIVQFPDYKKKEEFYLSGYVVPKYSPTDKNRYFIILMSLVSGIFTFFMILSFQKNENKDS